MGYEVHINQVDVFTRELGKGNTAGVMIPEESWSDEILLEIAKKAGFSESVFIYPKETGRYQLRFFSPGMEMSLCGHGTIGAVKFLKELGKVKEQAIIETKVGELAITIKDEEIFMAQDEADFHPFGGDLQKLCGVLGIALSGIEPQLPVVYGSTGTWTLLVPVKNEEVLAKMEVSNELFPDLLREFPKSSIHPFTIISEENYQFSARHFSSPFSGTKEDAVTGTASGVMGAYAQKYIYQQNKLFITVRQGKYLDREGYVKVYVDCGEQGKQQVTISGEAVVYPDCISVSIS